MSYNTVDLFATLCPYFGIIIALIFMLCFVRIITDCQYPGESPNPTPWIVGIVCFTLFIASILGGTSLTTQKNNMLKAYVSSGYSVYYNGEKIDGTKLDISKYSVTVNEENEELYLSDKPARSRRSYIPVVIPR